jgi:hypothetical protein
LNRTRAVPQRLKPRVPGDSTARLEPCPSVELRFVPGGSATPVVKFAENKRSLRICIGGRTLGLIVLVLLARTDRDAAVYGLEMKRCATLADVGVDVMIDLALNGDGEADRYAAVDRLCYQVC